MLRFEPIDQRASVRPPYYRRTSRCHLQAPDPQQAYRLVQFPDFLLRGLWILPKRLSDEKTSVPDLPLSDTTDSTKTF